MFTGIIEARGTITEKSSTALSLRSNIQRPRLGASIAINGCCLTVVHSAKNIHRFDVGPETWSKTNLGSLRVGNHVNVEPSLTLGSEVGGHFVTGHVDAAAPVISFQLWEQPFWRLRVALPQNLKGLVATKGSIAIDGVSLTVTQLGSSWFEVMLVPHTLAQTTMGQLKAGTFVNLEADPLARYAHAAALSLLRNKR
jgi:riboflavin synthase